MIFLHIQEAMQAVEALRGDPLLYVLVSGFVSIIIGLSGALVVLWKRNTQLQDANAEMNKAGIQALATFTPLMQGMDSRVQEAFVRIESAVDKSVMEIKGHVNLLKKLD